MGAGLIVVYVVVFIGIFYFMAIRPQQRQRRAHDQLVSSVKRGDQVVTAGGIFGTVKRIDDTVVSVEIAKGVQIRVAKRAIAEVLRDEAAAQAKKVLSRPANDDEYEDEAEDPDVAAQADEEPQPPQTDGEDKG